MPPFLMLMNIPLSRHLFTFILLLSTKKAVFVEFICKAILEKEPKPLQMEESNVFQRTENTPNLLENFYLPFGGRLNPNNR
ncbi:hypothetical protein D3C81_1595710 [compost metagenome]